MKNWDKEILIDGIPIDSVEWKETQFHYDDRIVKDLCNAILINAISDWRNIRMKEKGKSNTFLNKFTADKRASVIRFFESTFFENIVDVLFTGANSDAILDRIREIGPGRLTEANYGTSWKKHQKRNCIVDHNKPKRKRSGTA